jgi:hypothetical protein
VVRRRGSRGLLLLLLLVIGWCGGAGAEEAPQVGGD